MQLTANQKKAITNYYEELNAYHEKKVTHETDRIYFTPWPSLPPEDLHWLSSSRQDVCDRLSG